MSNFNALPTATDYLSISPNQNASFLKARAAAEDEHDRQSGSDTEAALSTFPSLSSSLAPTSTSFSSSSTSSSSSNKSASAQITCIIDGRELKMTAKELEEYQGRECGM